MKRILIVNTQLPFAYGGAEYLAEQLQGKLCEYGYQADLVKIPFKWYPPEKIPEQIIACRLLDLTQASGREIDLIVGLKFPAYYIPHPNKILWVLHQFRQIYDLWGTAYQDIPSTPEGNAVRKIIIQSDNKFLQEAKKIYSISQVVSKRMKNYNNIESIPLYPPLDNLSEFQCAEPEDFLFYPSRINPIKRQSLAIESMKYVQTKVRLIIAGAVEQDIYWDHLKKLVAENYLEKKVVLLGHISQRKKCELLSRSIGCLNVSFGEDYGYVTLESFYSKKPVVTCNDSGGPLEFVENNANGIVCFPEPKDLACAFDKLFTEKEKTKKLGETGYEKLLSLNITWEKVINVLVQ